MAQGGWEGVCGFEGGQAIRSEHGRKKVGRKGSRGIIKGRPVYQQASSLKEKKKEKRGSREKGAAH